MSWRVMGPNSLVVVLLSSCRSSVGLVPGLVVARGLG